MILSPNVKDQVKVWMQHDQTQDFVYLFSLSLNVDNPKLEIATYYLTLYYQVNHTAIKIWLYRKTTKKKKEKKVETGL